MPYIPMQGLAGQISFALHYRDTSQGQTWIEEVLLNVFEFKQSAETETDEFVNINRQLIDDFYGERVSIEFTLANYGDSMTSANPIEKIIKLYSMVNRIRNERETYRLKIFYRYPANVSIYDAMFTGSLLSIEEINQQNNSGQKKVMSFKSRTLETNIEIDQEYQLYKQASLIYVTDDEAEL